MAKGLAPIGRRQLNRADFDQLPGIIVEAGEKATWCFVEFFIANIRNKITRAAYAEAIGQFFRRQRSELARPAASTPNFLS